MNSGEENEDNKEVVTEEQRKVGVIHKRKDELL